MFKVNEEEILTHAITCDLGDSMLSEKSQTQKATQLIGWTWRAPVRGDRERNGSCQRREGGKGVTGS